VRAGSERRRAAVVLLLNYFFCAFYFLFSKKNARDISLITTDARRASSVRPARP